MWLKRPQKRGAEMEKSPPERCRPKIRNTTSVERRATPTRSSGNARSTKKYEKACNGQGRNFMPWVHTIMGGTGPVASRFQTKIYTKRDHKTQRSDRRRRRPQTRHTSTAETHSDTTTAPRRTRRQRGHPTPNKEPQRKRKKQRRRSARAAEAPPQAVPNAAQPLPTVRRPRRRTDTRAAEAPPQVAPTRRNTQNLGYGGRWQRAASVYGSRATHCGGLACHRGPRVGPHTLTPCRSTPYRRCRGRRSPRGQD